jgi:hypothetical protein
MLEEIGGIANLSIPLEHIKKSSLQPYSFCVQYEYGCKG